MSDAPEQVPANQAKKTVPNHPAAGRLVTYIPRNQVQGGGTCDDHGGFEVTGNPSPAQVEQEFNEAQAYADYLQQRHAQAAQQMGRVSSCVSSTKPFWVQLTSERNGDVAALPIMESGVAMIVNLKTSLAELCRVADAAVNNTRAAELTASFFGSNTAATSSLFELAAPTQFRLELIPTPALPDKPSLADRLSKLDPDLGRVCAQIWEDLYGTTCDPERGALFMLRQTWDHLFDRLAPDEAVRKSAHWTRKPGPKPDLVTREERIAYAVELHVRDVTVKASLLASSKQMTDLYQSLNRAHTRGGIDKEKARLTLRAVYDWFELWADALGL